MTTIYRDLPATWWGPPVATAASLPSSGLTGEVRLTLDTTNAYVWSGSSWVLTYASGSIGGPGVSVDGQIMLFNGTSGAVAKAATGSGFVKATSGVYGTQASVSLTADVAGVLPVANGGTNSSTALNNNRVIQSSGGKLVEAAAITASKALASDVNGIPVASTTSDTELGYVAGVTSAIQTQINGKEPSITSGTTAQFWRGDKSFQTLNTAAMTAVTDGSTASLGAIGEVLTATQATNTAVGVGATGTYGNAISISLTAGAWHVWGTAGFSANGANLTTGLQCGISSSSTGAGLSEFDTQLAAYLMSSTSDALLAAPAVLVNLAATTTYYLNTQFWYTAGSPQHRGKIYARRLR